MGYSDTIRKATGITNPTHVALIEDCMRDVIFHSTLDWQDRETFNKGAIEALGVCVAMGDIPKTAPLLIAIIPDPMYFDGNKRKEIYGSTPAELASALRKWVVESGYGASDIGAMFDVYRNNRKVAVLRYNGRFDWNTTDDAS